jgi:hypothetical protein
MPAGMHAGMDHGMDHAATDHAATDHASMQHESADHAAMAGESMEHEGGGTPVLCFDWPVSGWARGFRVEIRDKNGAPLPRTLLHHVTVVNFGRRQLVFPVLERLIGAGKETEDVMLPRPIAVPMDPGQRLGMWAAWHNESGADIDGAVIRLTMTWTPVARRATPLGVLPLYLDVNEENVFGGYDLPPGRSTKSFDFTLPTGGRLLGAGGHLHDYAVAMRLEDGATGKTIVRLRSERDADGRIRGVSRKRFIFRPRRLRPGHPYRLVAEYDNPTGQPLARAAMAQMIAIFAPDDLGRWAVVDPNDPNIRRELEGLAEMNRGAAGLRAAETSGREHEHH